MILNKQNLILFFSILAMAGLTAGTFLPGGSLLQKILFLAGALIMTLAAYTNKQKMFLTIQIVVVISSVLAFWDMASLIKYIIFIGASILSVIYLIKIKYLTEDKWWPIGAFGLLLLAAGYATNAVIHPILFNAFFIFGGIFVALYSGLGLFLFKVRIAALWLIVNIIFIINPVIIVCKALFQ